MSSRLEDLRRSYRSSRIASERAEILELIDKLSAQGRAPVRRTQRQRSVVLTPAERPTNTRARATGEALLSPGLAALLRSLEVRIGLLEERIAKVTRYSSRPAPPVSQQQLVDPASYTFSGTIQGQMLSDMLQLVSSNSMSGMFVVENETTSCKLFFDEGRICHAQAGKFSGENAFFAAFALASGRYFFHETTKLPAQRTIDSSTQFLILEALRKIDESTAEAAPDPEAGARGGR